MLENVYVDRFSSFTTARLAYLSLLTTFLLTSGCSNSQDSHVLSDEELLEHEFFETDGVVEFGDLPKIHPAQSLLKTDVLPHLEGTIVAGRNYLYCGTFKLAWDAIGEAASMSEESMGKALDRLNFTKADLDSDSYLSVIGNRNEIMTGLEEKFPDANIDLPEGLSSEIPFSFVYLQKYLPFREKFNKLKTPLIFQAASESSKVNCFGIDSFFEGGTQATVHRMQISILDYKTNDDYVLRLNTMSKRDQLILAKVSPSNTLGETLRGVQERVRNAYSKDDEKSSLQEGEAMIVPIISVGVMRQYDELKAKSANGEGIGQQSAYQVIQFRLDESGAKLKSYADFSGLGEEGKPRRFIFDKPFLLYLVQKDSQNPYLVAWIENDEFMELASPQE